MSKFKIKNTIYHGTIADIDNIDLQQDEDTKILVRDSIWLMIKRSQ